MEKYGQGGATPYFLTPAKLGLRGVRGTNLGVRKKLKLFRFLSASKCTLSWSLSAMLSCLHSIWRW